MSKMKRMKKVASLLASVALLGVLAAGCSQETAKNSPAGSSEKEVKYPTKPIEITVPFAAGGGTDLNARAMSEYLSEKWGQPINVVNKPGAGGATGTLEVLKKGSKDGYSILTQSASAGSALFAGNPNLPFKLEDLRFIARLAVDPLAYVVKADAPWNNLKEFNEWVKQNPDKLTFASNGTTAIATFGVIQWMDSIGADFSKAKLVMTNGSGDALPKVAGGHIVLGVQGVSEVANLVKAGKLKILGIASSERSPYFPDVPTLEEQGVKGVTVTQWYGVSAPKEVPDEIVKKWEKSIEEMLNDPVYQEKLKSIVVQPSYLNSDEFTKYVQDEVERFKQIANEKGLVK